MSDNISYDVQRFTFGLSTCVLQTVQVKKRVYENIFDENMIYCSQVSKIMMYSLAHCANVFFISLQHACAMFVYILQRRSCGNPQCKTDDFTMLSHTEQVNFTPFKHIVIRNR